MLDSDHHERKEQEKRDVRKSVSGLEFKLNGQ
jgi:hypothetical protein